MPGANLTRTEAGNRRAVVKAPVNYEVRLDLTRGPRTFGSVTVVHFDAEPGSSTFLDLIADDVEAITLNGIGIDPSEAYRDSRVLLTGLEESNEVTVTATCRYSTTGEGLHRSVDPSDGNVYLYTQFEVPDARRVYAVFDQPDIKAVFRFRVLAPESWTVLSNKPAESVEDTDATTAEGTLGDHPAEKTKRWTFEPTPVMSSYLTAVCAGPYAGWHSEYANEDGRTIPMGMYCRQALKDSFAPDVDYLFDVTKKGFAFYARTWGVPYPYAKFDQIYVPEYNAGAMENIGLVTIRDQYVFESKVTDALAERRVVTVLHELAHMWFGDYVTMKWWNDLWLNESFAEFMSTLATAEATDWTDAWATFCSGEKSWALRQDQLPTTHPIVAPINDLNDTYVNFDGITYAKGASVLRQLVAYVGRERFFQGINHYLEKHAYSNATLGDLLAELEQASDRDLRAWSAQWLEEAGITTLSTEVTEDADGTIGQLRIAQTAPAEHPTLRVHRLGVGFYDLDDLGAVVRTDGVELDVDGSSTEVAWAAGRRRPAFILPNDGDLTYAKLRFDERSLVFAEKHLPDFRDALARSVVWLSLWDMTRDGEFPAERFIDLSLRALARESESTTFRYALAQVGTTAWHYTDPARRDEVVRSVASRLWGLAQDAKPGSDEQFQLVMAYLGYGEPDDDEFASHVRGLLDGSVAFDGLTVDNNLRWTIVNALAAVGLMDADAIDAELARRDTTENREFAYGARAARGTAEAKAWAWDEALGNDGLTNMQLEAVVRGMVATP
uniref:aminopeptidase N n=1 Tax=uncultured Bifidobacterium sp. TaxID=165187 RepID=UPI0028DCEAE4